MRAPALTLAAALALTLAGCGKEYSVRLQLQSSPPIEPELGRSRVVMVEGIAIGTLALAFDGDDPEDEDEPIDLISNDTSILDVRPGLEPNQFILVARRAGSTTIDAFVDEEAAEPIQVRVEAQASGP